MDVEKSDRFEAEETCEGCSMALPVTTHTLSGTLSRTMISSFPRKPLVSTP